VEIETRKALCTSQSDAWRYSFRGTNLHRQVMRGISSCDVAKSVTIKLKLMESMSHAFSTLSSCRRSLKAATVNEVSTKFLNLTVSKYCSLVASDSEWAAKHRNLTLKSYEYVFWTSTPPRKLIPLPTRLQPRRTACKVSLLLHDDNVYWIFASSKDSNEADVNVSVHVPLQAALIGLPAKEGHQRYPDFDL
jgi:hypothetical protein